MVNFHKLKEQQAKQSYDDAKKQLEEEKESAEAAERLRQLKHVKPLITVMGVTRKNDYGEVQGPTIVSHSGSSEILHYADAHERASNNDVINAGIYYISTDIYSEFEKEHPQICIEEDLRGMQDFSEAVDPGVYGIQDNFEIEMASLSEDFYNVDSSPTRRRKQSFQGPRSRHGS
mmetsp:Transcript_33336/g.43900  ORF Transcript_33336/g.43900 Transcript_33336/m.43900 type:complete len:175 (-) Transcript_33336:773-1297(-)|eukprot:CAMPEP_0185575944 /NCGR_PEP_ID=MMETSP0434-20130131/6999_1 /TAXON_ID=626734 ORGANISM="Favella taraikaensis, Strain Fe Narragansett Bay" /NCGR_SAMPLE_ID=MMETSP0434 /ASSEMBLY_ACC=CAM_ASM_000379 /LENGTH=174 /DNA_ID=CAMNT_0028192975 /DNA_START=336 /DNA_END=860 /DNA_ORIENTATION=+